MVEPGSELIFEILEKIQDEIASLHCKLDEIKGELPAVRNHSIAVQQDVQNICGILSRHDARLDRMERRLEIAEVG